MDKTFVQFTKDHFFIQNFLEQAAGNVELCENGEDGKSLLHISCSNEMLVIRNLDQVGSREGDLGGSTTVGFLRLDKAHGLCKRVDHMIFENFKENLWNVHLIEMKSGVTSNEKGIDIKGKFRASYLLAHMIASVLAIKIETTRMYTTYERVDLKPSAENPVVRKARLGFYAFSSQEEWSGGRFALNINGRRPFQHTPLKMKRNAEGILVGECRLCC